jgi:hypothetical protein
MLIAVIDGMLRVVETLWPKIDEAVKSGEITAEAQAMLKARIEKLRVSGFSEPEWKV